MLLEVVFLVEDMLVVADASVLVDVCESQVQIFFLDSEQPVNPLLSDEQVMPELFDVFYGLLTEDFFDEVVPDVAGNPDVLEKQRRFRA